MNKIKVYLILLSLIFAQIAYADDIVMCSEFDYAPFEMTAKDGTKIGLDVELITRFAESRGDTLVIIPTAWDDLIPNTNAGRCDIIASGMTITKERLESVDFTIPYVASGLALMVNNSKSGTIKSFRDINSPNVHIAVKGNIMAGYIVKTFFDKANITYTDSEAAANAMVANGTADVTVGDIMYFVPTHREPELVNRTFLITDTFTYEPLGIAVKKGNRQLLNDLNSFLGGYKADGELERLVDYWVYGNAWEDLI